MLDYTTDDDEYNSKRDSEGFDFYSGLTDDRPPLDFDPHALYSEDDGWPYEEDETLYSNPDKK